MSDKRDPSLDKSPQGDEMRSPVGEAPTPHRGPSIAPFQVDVMPDEADAVERLITWAVNRGEYDFGTSRPAALSLAGKLQEVLAVAREEWEWFGKCDRTNLCFWQTGPNYRARALEAVEAHNNERGHCAQLVRGRFVGND